MTAELPTVDLDDIKNALRGVIDPELGDNIVDLGMVRSISIDGTDVTVEVALTIASCPLRTQLQDDIKRYAGAVHGHPTIHVTMGTMSPEERSNLMSRARRGAQERSSQNVRIAADTRIIAIASGKGGVGKSSVSVNLAVTLARQGFDVGILDADITGFSVPRLTGFDTKLTATDGRIQPTRRPVGTGSLTVVSMGLIEGSGDDEAIMLRGLMLNRALQHFLEDVEWGTLDYLVIDLPPGTSDVQMGLARMLPQAALFVVTTPALATQQVAARTIDMARRSHQRVAGIIENMSSFTCDHGTSYALFGEGGGTRLAESSGVPLLAQLPFHPDVVAAGDTGTPITSSAKSDHPVHLAFENLARFISSSVMPPVKMDGCATRLVDAINAALPPKP